MCVKYKNCVQFTYGYRQFPLRNVILWPSLFACVFVSVNLGQRMETISWTQLVQGNSSKIIQIVISVIFTGAFK